MLRFAEISTYRQMVDDAQFRVCLVAAGLMCGKYTREELRIAVRVADAVRELWLDVAIPSMRRAA